MHWYQADLEKDFFHLEKPNCIVNRGATAVGFAIVTDYPVGTSYEYILYGLVQLVTRLWK